ncbi:MAG TPA: hypothetical protein VES69_12455, partial [Pyrinomonadaceae bacterium]|nr:hypothetical protein [Pyrinomonadaceae bacterium]
GRFPKVYRAMTHPVEHAARVTSNGVSIPTPPTRCIPLLRIVSSSLAYPTSNVTWWWCIRIGVIKYGSLVRA